MEREILNVLPDGVAMFPSDIYTDKSSKFIASEVVREKSLLFLQEEIPHGIAIDIVSFEESDRCVKINVNIVTESERHKQIIIGKNGEMLKQIGIAARRDIEDLVGTKANIDLFVKVRKDWKNDVLALNDLGFNKKDN